MDFFKWKIDLGLLVFCLFAFITFIQLTYHWLFFSRLAFFKPARKEKSQTQPVSVIVCARDEAANLATNLPGILVQTYPTTHEVIVVNDNSVDESKYVIAELQKDFKNLQHVELKHEAKGIPGKKYPLSIGIKEAKHEVLLLTDSDCVPASEFWIQKMQDAYTNGVEIVLGYGAYHKKPGLLNKIIRFETFQSALQFFSFALAGLPYMGVGRNLSYKKAVFFRHKGFAAHNNIPGGDDDLFVNTAATKRNTKINIDKNSFTVSRPATTWDQWKTQKRRHYTTGKYYKASHKILLGLYSLSHFLFYPLLITACIFYNWQYGLIIFSARLLIQAIVFWKCLNKLGEKDLFPMFLFFDLWMFFYYFIFAPALILKPQPTWK
jgi:glycosyltransferase involved in cell wall biosynthesis